MADESINSNFPLLNFADVSNGVQYNYLHPFFKTELY